MKQLSPAMWIEHFNLSIKEYQHTLFHQGLADVSWPPVVSPNAFRAGASHLKTPLFSASNAACMSTLFPSPEWNSREAVLQELARLFDSLRLPAFAMPPGFDFLRAPSLECIDVCVKYVKSVLPLYRMARLPVHHRSPAQLRLDNLSKDSGDGSGDNDGSGSVDAYALSSRVITIFSAAVMPVDLAFSNGGSGSSKGNSRMMMDDGDDDDDEDENASPWDLPATAQERSQLQCRYANLTHRLNQWRQVCELFVYHRLAQLSACDALMTDSHIFALVLPSHLSKTTHTHVDPSDVVASTIAQQRPAAAAVRQQQQQHGQSQQQRSGGSTRKRARSAVSNTAAAAAMSSTSTTVQSITCAGGAAGEFSSNS
jgi:hypothetical protein